MRLWTLHPRYLDTSGLVACWREALLAQQVLTGKTKGYRYHPQLRRFRRTDDPVSAIRLYLRALLQEADRRAFRFDPSRIGTPIIFIPPLPTTTGQLEFERNHLLGKLEKRSPALAAELKKQIRLIPHPLFFVRQGIVEAWEKIPADSPH